MPSTQRWEPSRSQHLVPLPLLRMRVPPRNKVRRWSNATLRPSKHDADAFRNVIADSYVQHNGRAGQGLAGTQATLRGYFATFPDMHAQVDDLIIDGDKVVARLTFTATHDHPVQLGPNAPVFPPTGKKLSWGDIEIWRVADGKFAEHWDQSDLAGLARQMRAE
jgi:predicted ester cyclase